MNQPLDSRFKLGIPQELPQQERFAFWLTTTDRKLLATVSSMNCVASVKRHRPTGRILVAISTDHDPDEAWHWIYRELEEAASYVELDDIWVEALKWIL